VSTGTDALIYGAIAAIATWYGVVLARRFGAPDVVDGDHQPTPIAAVVAIVFGIVLGASAAVGVALGWTEPYWVPEPLLILVLYVLLGKRERIREKALGTALGVAGAIPVAILSPPAGVLTAVGIVAFVVAFTQAKRYWLMYGLYTFSLVLVLATPGHVGYEAEERGVQILVGISLLVVGLAVVTSSPDGCGSATRSPNSRRQGRAPDAETPRHRRMRTPSLPHRGRRSVPGGSLPSRSLPAGGSKSVTGGELRPGIVLLRWMDSGSRARCLRVSPLRRTVRTWPTTVTSGLTLGM
jgi:hypothetical protein